MMKVLLLSNALTHHQKPLSDELYRLLGDGNYYFVCTKVLADERIQMGWPLLDAPYLIQYNHESDKVIREMLRDFDAVIYGLAPLSMVKQRLLNEKLTLCASERRYKTIARYLKYPINTYKSYYLNKGFLLASGAYATRDYILSGMSPEKCFRWGYFPETKKYLDLDELISSKGFVSESNSIVTILWAGRMIKWKHPEKALQTARLLKKEGYKFSLKMIGSGIMERELIEMVKLWNLEDYVCFKGNMSPEDVRLNMEKSDIFLFTSDRQEGWGAVLNESMNSACAVVSSNLIGAVPFLINSGENGLIYNCYDTDELYRHVKFLIDNPSERIKMQKSAYYSIIEMWNPQKAAKNLLLLLEALINGKNSPIKAGPCSQAPVMVG